MKLLFDYDNNNGVVTPKAYRLNQWLFSILMGQLTRISRSNKPTFNINMIKDKLIDFTNKLSGQNHAFIIDISRKGFVDQQIIHPIRLTNYIDSVATKDFGFAFDCPFEDLQGEEFKKFTEISTYKKFIKYEHNGLTYFSLNCGMDIDFSVKVCSELLINLYGYTENTEFEFEIHMQGLIT